jgi:type III secretion protein L
LSNLIKARTLDPGGEPVIIRRTVQAAQTQADEIVVAAQQEAAEILEDARLEAEQLKKTAKQDGYQNGLAEWNQVLASAWKARDEYLAQNEPAALQLAVRVAGKLLGEELAASPEKIASIVCEALKATQRARTFVVQAHPADVPLLQERLARLRTVVGPAREIEVISSTALSRGDCVIESDIGIIDARLETQLELMEKALVGAKAI